MEINYKDPKTDALGNLYRTALFLAEGDVKTGLSCLEKALTGNPKEQKRLAEHALDEYKRQLQNLSSQTPPL